MDPRLAPKPAAHPRLSRLGELMARAGARQRRAKQIARVPSDCDAPPVADSIEALFRTYGDLSIGEIMEQTGQARTTVHRRLVELVEAGTLARRGQGRASRYHRARN